MTSTRVRIGLVLTACAALVVACSSSEQSGGNGQSPPKMEPLSAVGNGEGQLNLIAWAGYAENGSLGVRNHRRSPNRLRGRPPRAPVP